MKLTRTVIFSMLLSAGASVPALAGLGGDATSVDADRASVKGTVRVSTGAGGFAVHQINGAGGMQIHEYLGADGKVFAVSWSGPGAPNLGEMLGPYYAQVQLAMSRPHYNHHHLSVVTPEVVVQSSGHLRTFSGRAWAPALLPKNFSATDIK